ncbi:stability/partitioning determinant [Methylobacterium sp. WL12]|uniref:stability/partitioning determinant n=1 Tax=Methylobacterium sp. WL12 TaxID=2603890 RepID=UPI0011CC61E5|nr:stability/partitioning determinant [Methylobacterium sp. WL12]TXM64528.1 stability/partitioning determinant [Methylobacterium sp. WL12]
MSNLRAKLFDGDDDLDLTAFKPKAAPDKAAPLLEKVREVSEAANFHSREPTKVTPKPAADPTTAAAVKPRRQPRTHRTGRNVQFNVKASQDAIDAFYRISDEQGWVLGETLERALSALERDLTAKP